MNMLKCEHKTIKNDLAEIICHSPTENIFAKQNNPCISISDNVKIVAVRNEFECAQITIKPVRDIEFDVSVSDLTDNIGNKIDSSAVNIFLKKPMFCEYSWHGNGFPATDYPDILVPFEAAKAYGENKISAGDIGGFWIEVKIPKNAKTGMYKGAISVNIGFLVKICFNVEVLEPVLDDKMTMQTIFNTFDEYIAQYEKGDLNKIYSNYAQFLLEHRVCQTGLVYPVNLFVQPTGDENENIEILTQAIVDWEKKGINTFNIPTKEIKIDDIPYFESEYAYKFICSLIKKCVENKKDYISMLIFYDHLNDEPFGVLKENGRVKKAINMFVDVKKRAAEFCKQLNIDENLKISLVNSILSIPDIYTDYFKLPNGNRKPLLDEAGNQYNYNYQEVTLCPKFDAFDLPEIRADYDVYKDKKWWYGCNAPNTPYPEYSIDECSADCRIISWMMADYNITGNLYWATNYWEDHPYAVGEIPDYLGSNGEGIILYNGSRYGLDKPVGSIRLSNIREGNEEFELIKNLFEIYEKNGLDGREIYNRMVCGFYNGTRVDSENVLFDLARESLVRILDCAISEFKTFFSVHENKDDFDLTIYSCKNANVSIDGYNQISEDNGVFKFKIPYKFFDKIEISINKSGKIKKVPLFAGRGINILLHEELYDNNSVSGDIEKTTLNTHFLHRELNIIPCGKTPKIIIKHHFDKIKTWATLEVRAVEKLEYTVFINGKPIAKGNTIENGWNKIDFEIEDNAESFEIVFTKACEIALGSLYIRQ